MLIPPYLIVNTTQDAAIPLVSSSVLLTDRVDRCESIDHCRTIWNVVWSCLITISLCIWVGIHPNLPQLHPPREHWYSRRALLDKIQAFVDKLAVALLALLAPEFIFVWALRQRLNASSIAKRCQEAANNAATRRQNFENEYQEAIEEARASGYEPDADIDSLVDDWEAYKTAPHYAEVLDQTQWEVMLQQRWIAIRGLEALRGPDAASESRPSSSFLR